MAKTKQTEAEQQDTREEREAKIREQMRADIEAKRKRNAERKPGGWCRVTGHRARCDNPQCGARARGSLRVYREVHSEDIVSHSVKEGKAGLRVHTTTQATNAHALILCENCKLRQLVHEFDLVSLLDDDALPPRSDMVALTGVQLDDGHYEALRLMAMNERNAPSDPVIVPEVVRLRSRQRKDNMADDLDKPLPANSIG